MALGTNTYSSSRSTRPKAQRYLTLSPAGEHGERATQGAQEDHSVDTIQFTGAADGDRDADALSSRLALADKETTPTPDITPVRDNDELADADTVTVTDDVKLAESEELSDAESVVVTERVREQEGLTDFVTVDDTLFVTVAEVVGDSVKLCDEVSVDDRELDEDPVVLPEGEELTESEVVNVDDADRVPLTDPVPLPDEVPVLLTVEDAVTVPDDDWETVVEAVRDTELDRDAVLLCDEVTLFESELVTVPLADTVPLRD